MGKYDTAPTLAAGLLRTARDMAEVTQAELAARAGVSQQSISAYETGRKDPTVTTLTRLLAAAGLEMRIRLEPLDSHDAVLEQYMETVDPHVRSALADARNRRVEAARLRRLRGQ